MEEGGEEEQAPLPLVWPSVVLLLWLSLLVGQEGGLSSCC